MNQKQEFTKNIFFIILFLLSFLLLVYIFKSFLMVIVLSLIFASLLSPIQNVMANFFTKLHFRKVFLYWLNILNKYSDFFSTIIIILFILFITIIFVLWILIPLGQEIINLATFVKSLNFTQMLYKINNYKYFDYFRKLLATFNVSIGKNDIIQFMQTKIQSIIGYFSKFVFNIIVASGKFIIDYLIMMFILFYFLSSGDKIIQVFKRISPLEENDKNLLISKFKGIVRSSFFGIVIASGLEGFLGALPFLIFGYDYIVWAIVMTFLSMIPIVGISAIWLPTAIYFIIMTNYKIALTFIIWGTLISASETIIRERMFNITSGKDRIHPLLMFFAILGGIKTFGIYGLVFGPVIVVIFITLLNFYQRDYVESN